VLRVQLELRVLLVLLVLLVQVQQVPQGLWDHRVLLDVQDLQV
jgi:hypothetical protein